MEEITIAKTLDTEDILIDNSLVCVDIWINAGKKMTQNSVGDSNETTIEITIFDVLVKKYESFIQYIYILSWESFQSLYLKTSFQSFINYYSRCLGTGSFNGGLFLLLLLLNHHPSPSSAQQLSDKPGLSRPSPSRDGIFFTRSCCNFLERYWQAAGHYS